VVTFNWRDCDPLISVAGFDFHTVDAKACELAREELDRAVEDDLTGSDGSESESEIRDRLESDLCSTGVNRFAYPTDLEDLGIDAEHVHELETQGLTVY
jgi:hypothetical protein